MGGKGLVWDVKDSLAADTDAPYRARICHAGREICAPAARGQSGGETACPLTAASPSASSASRPASSASPTSKNAPCSQEISTGLHPEKNWGERKNRLSPLFFISFYLHLLRVVFASLLSLGSLVGIG